MWFKFLFAKQNPKIAAFSPLHVMEEEYTEPLGLADAASSDDICSPLCRWKHSFTCDRLAVKMAHEMGDPAADDVFVLTGLIDSGSKLVADGPEYRLSQFVAGLQQLDKLGKQR